MTALIAKTRDSATTTIAKLSIEGGRKTVDFYRPTGIDVASKEWIAVPANDPEGQPERFPVAPVISQQTGLVESMACETPQLAWNYAASKGYKVRAIMSEPALASALATPANGNDAESTTEGEQ